MVSSAFPISTHSPLCVPKNEGSTVLKISMIEAPNKAVTIWLEGQLRGLWVEELRRSCEQWLARGSGLLLDLSDVSFVDSNGGALCRSLRERNVAILRCSPFVAEQLKGYEHEDDRA
jgi:anti-anti-sigma regulatory factor